MRAPHVAGLARQVYPPRRAPCAHVHHRRERRAARHLRRAHVREPSRLHRRPVAARAPACTSAPGTSADSACLSRSRCRSPQRRRSAGRAFSWAVRQRQRASASAPDPASRPSPPVTSANSTCGCTRRSSHANPPAPRRSARRPQLRPPQLEQRRRFALGVDPAIPLPQHRPSHPIQAPRDHRPQCDRPPRRTCRAATPTILQTLTEGFPPSTAAMRR